MKILPATPDEYRAAHKRFLATLTEAARVVVRLDDYRVRVDAPCDVEKSQ